MFAILDLDLHGYLSVCVFLCSLCLFCCNLFNDVTVQLICPCQCFNTKIRGKISVQIYTPFTLFLYSELIGCCSFEQLVDFCCGANDFSCLMKKRLDEMGKKCSYKNFDVLQAKVSATFKLSELFRY